MLRYSAYTTTIMATLAAGAIGDVVAVEHLEPVGWWHYAHSYVRAATGGGGRVQPDADGQVLPRRRLAVLRRRSARRPGVVVRQPHPLHGGEQAGGAGRAARLRRRARLPLLGLPIYLDHVDEPAAQQWPLSILAVEVNRATITEALRTGPYGRCVYDCDNDVVDHQVVNIEYAAGSRRR